MTAASVLCGKPTPTGPCRRPVSAPGGPCGADHVAVSPTGAPPSGTPVPAAPPADPFGPGGVYDDGYQAGWEAFQAGEPRPAEPADQDTPTAELGAWEAWGDAEAERRAARAGW